ncbi:MAG: hypothetical protein HOD06_03885 [Candidatus Komeilibacteria bacterium]|jgi:hypothetical protein|nr:hypothetical protein [Candidatus Komeilibacteria bacterium]
MKYFKMKGVEKLIFTLLLLIFVLPLLITIIFSNLNWYPYHSLFVVLAAQYMIAVGIFSLTFPVLELFYPTIEKLFSLGDYPSARGFIGNMMLVIFYSILSFLIVKFIGFLTGFKNKQNNLEQ